MGQENSKYTWYLEDLKAKFEKKKKILENHTKNVFDRDMKTVN